MTLPTDLPNESDISLSCDNRNIGSKLTVPTAAALLHVSQPYLLELLETNQIPNSRIGNKLFLRYVDVIQYKDDMDAARRKILDELVAEAQAMNMGY